MTNQGPAFKRILLKLSGEALMGQQGDSIDPGIMRRIAGEVQRVQGLDVEIAIVVGGGNIWRGQNAERLGMDRATADYMGMLATVINALALQDALEQIGLVTRVQTGIEMPSVAEPFIRRRATRHLEKGRVVILAAGTGNPYFTTDTAAALRAVELNCQVLLKATKVDGVYDSDPLRNAAARRFKTLSYMQALNMEVQVMDSTAISLCKDNHLPIIVFNLNEPGGIESIINGEHRGTLVSDPESPLQW
jgi:uridylate kinase